MSDRTKYQQQLDEERLSPQKADETLSLLLKENERLNEKQEKKLSVGVGKHFQLMKYAPIFASVAAAILIAFVFLPGKDAKQGGTEAGKTHVTYGTVAYVEKSVTRAGNEDFEAVFDDIKIEEFFPGLKYIDGIASSSKDAREGEAYFELEGNMLTAYVGDRKDDLSEKLSNVPSYYGAKFNLDEETGYISAVYQKQGLWVRLVTKNMENEAFESLIERLAQ